MILASDWVTVLGSDWTIVFNYHFMLCSVSFLSTTTVYTLADEKSCKIDPSLS